MARTSQSMKTAPEVLPNGSRSEYFIHISPPRITTMARLLRESSRDRALDPIIATRSGSFDNISAKRTSSWRSAASGNSTDQSLAYSTDTEVRELMEELRCNNGGRVPSDVAIRHPPFETPPRVRSNKSVVNRRQIPPRPPPVHIANEQVPPMMSITTEDVEKTAKKFETFVTARIDQAISPVEERIETFLVDVQSLAQLQAPKLESRSLSAIESEAESVPKVESAISVEEPAPLLAQDNGLFAGLLESLFRDEPIPVLPAADSLSDESSAATEHTEESSISSGKEVPDKPKEKRCLPSYTQVMEALLRDEAIPDPLGEGIPLDISLSIQISHVE